MLNIEELLIKIMQILDFDMNEIKLKHASQKKRFYTNEEGTEKYREHISLILEKLDIDGQNEEVINIFIDLINLYTPIYNKLNSTKFIATEEKINWIILKRLVIPYLAKRFSSLDCDYDNRADKGLSGGKFWYLPDITKYPEVKFPMEYIMNWWLDLYGKGLDSLCNEIDNNNPNEEKSIESKNTIKQWFKKSIPDRKSIKEYCSIPLNYTGTFEIIKYFNLDSQFKRACDFLINVKQLSIEDIKHEIPCNSLVDGIFINEESVSTSEKEKFIKFVSERWNKPTSNQLIHNLIIARSSQSLYKGLLKYFSFNDSFDIEENKLLQLVYLYSFIYNENLQRELYQTPINDINDITAINHEYLDPFNTGFTTIIETLSNDINIELANQDFKKNHLEDIYQVKTKLYLENKVTDKLKIAGDELVRHLNYFHLKFDKIEEDMNKYFDLSLNEKSKFIDKSDDFQFLVNVYQRELFINYELSEKCVFQMEKLSNTDDDKIIVKLSFLQLYTLLIFEKNINKINEIKILLEEYEHQVKDIKEKQIELLRIKIHFYIKSKDFDNALKFSNEYFSRYIKSSKKDLNSIEMLFLGAYSAYIQKDKSSLKQYNKYLKKHASTTFENSQSLPFRIFFYKK